MLGQPIASSHLRRPEHGAGVSRPGALGTQLGICTKMLIGMPIASSCISLTPGIPSTLAISCGSMNMRRRAMRDHGAGEFGDGHHAAFDMHVAVAKAGHEIAAVGVDRLRVRCPIQCEASGPT